MHYAEGLQRDNWRNQEFVLRTRADGSEAIFGLSHLRHDLRTSYFSRCTCVPTTDIKIGTTRTLKWYRQIGVLRRRFAAHGLDGNTHDHRQRNIRTTSVPYVGGSQQALPLDRGLCSHAVTHCPDRLRRPTPTHATYAALKGRSSTTTPTFTTFSAACKAVGLSTLDRKREGLRHLRSGSSKSENAPRSFTWPAPRISSSPLPATSGPTASRPRCSTMCYSAPRRASGLATP